MTICLKSLKTIKRLKPITQNLAPSQK